MIINFFNSNFFIAFVTFVVGGFAIELYLKQKRDQKREAAEIILMEIRNAEKTLNQIKDMGIGENIRNLFILPTNSWNDYRHLFVKNFDKDEWDLVNNFYSKCVLAEKALEEIRDNLYTQLVSKAECIQRFLGQIALIATDEKDYENKRNAFLKRFGDEGYLFSPRQLLKDLVVFLSSISMITTSTVGARLKKIAKIFD